MSDAFAFTGNNTHSGNEAFVNQIFGGLANSHAALLPVTFTDPDGNAINSAAVRNSSLIDYGATVPTDTVNPCCYHKWYWAGQLTIPITGKEVHAGLFGPVRIKMPAGSGGSVPDEVNTLAIANMLYDPTSGAATAATASNLKIEANPPTAFVNGLGCFTNASRCVFGINNGGALLQRNPIDFSATGTGVEQFVGDLSFNNLDTTAAGTITFYNGGAIRLRIANTGATNIPNALRVGDNTAPNVALDVVGGGRVSAPGNTATDIVTNGATQTLTSKTLTAPTINGINSGAASFTGINNFPGNTAALTADWTCGTAGTVSSCVAATIIGSGGGVPLTFTLPLAAQSYTLECDGVVGQATAATANQWNLLTATNGATNVTASYSMATAATASAYGAVTDQASTTTTFQIAPSWTLGGTATKMPFHIYAKIEGASVSGAVVSLQLVAPTVGDLVTIYRGAACRVF